jgi:predicted lipase
MVVQDTWCYSGHLINVEIIVEMSSGVTKQYHPSFCVLYCDSMIFGKIVLPNNYKQIEWVEIPLYTPLYLCV